MQVSKNRSRQSSMIVVPRERKNLRLDDQFGRLHKHGLSRDERRTLFEAKVKEEARHKAMKSIILAQHNYYCRALGLRPKETPLFDKYPEYVFVGDKWIDLPKPSSVGLAELSPEDADSFSVPKMAWLPDEAYRATDPKAVNPRDIYPPGICPPEPAPPPRIIRVPGREATEWDVMLYYEEIYKQQPKSEPGSPSRPENVDNGEIDAMALSGALKRKLPPYPGHEHIPATPKVIFFDPDAGKPAPLPKEDPTPVAGPPVAAPVPAPVPAPMPAPTTAGGSQLPGSESATPLPAGSGTGTPVQVPGTPSGGSSTSRPESRADSLTGGWVTSSSIITPTAAPSALKCLTPFSISTSSNKRKQGSINLDTFEPTPVNSRQKLEPEQKGDQRKRRSLDADLQACVAGGQQDPAAIGQKPPGQSLDNSLMDRIRAELKLGPQVDPDRISLDQELSPDYKSPSPVERRNSLYTSPSPSPIPRTETETEVSIKRTAPRTIDHTNSEPTYGVEEKNSIPFSNTGGRSELRSEILGQVNDPAELEFCDTLPTSATNNLSDVGLPVASTIMQANTSTWTSDSVEANGVPTNGNGTESNGELVIRLPRSWRAARDGSGRVYYYHVEERVPQWEPPVATQQHQANNTEYPTSSGDTMSRDDMEMETETSSEDSEEDEDEEKENTEENCEPIEENELVTDYDLSASEKKMLLRMRDRSQSAKQERSNRRKAKRRAERERREQEREMLEARSERHRTTGLVAEMLIPRDRNNSVAKEIREKLKNKDEILRQIDEEIMMDEFTERQEQDRLRREQIKAEKMKREITQPRLPDINIPITPSSSNLAAGGGTPASKAAPAAANSAINIPGLGGLDEIPAAASSAAVQAADTSGMAEAEKRAKDKFIKEMSGVIVKALTPFRMKGCKKGFIKNNEDFKHLAKKLTHVIYEKERARVNSAQAIKLSDKMREKATEYVKKKMNSYDREYKRSPGHK